MLGDLYYSAIVDHFAKLMHNENASKLRAEKVESGVDANWSSEEFTEYADLSRVCCVDDVDVMLMMLMMLC
jgi:hypothetical protein